MSTSIYKIAEQCKIILGSRGDMQSIIASCIDVYATQVKASWYENKAADCSEINGTFITTFGKTESLVPTLDVSTDMYYILIPSSYISLPNEMGINMVSYMKGQTNEFVRIGAGSLSMWNRLKASELGGRQTYYVEGVKMYFPKMKSVNVADILLKMTVALDVEDVEEDLNIPPNIVDMIVNGVVAKFMPKQEVIPETLN
jgi:hypothetical protein